MADNKTKPGRLFVRLTDEDMERVKAAAERDRRNVSDWVRLVLEDALAESENQVRTRKGR